MKIYFFIVLTIYSCHGLNSIEDSKKDDKKQQCIQVSSVMLDLTKIAGTWYKQQQVILTPMAPESYPDFSEMCEKIKYFDTKRYVAKMWAQTFLNTTETSTQFPEVEGSVTAFQNGTYELETHIKGTKISTTAPGVILSVDPDKYMVFLGCSHDDPDVSKTAMIITRKELSKEEMRTLWEDAATKLKRDFSKMKPLKFGMFC